MFALWCWLCIFQMLFNFVNGNNNTYHILIQINLVEYFGCLVNIKIIYKGCYVRFVSVCLDKLKGLFSPFCGRLGKRHKRRAFVESNLFCNCRWNQTRQLCRLCFDQRNGKPFVKRGKIIMSKPCKSRETSLRCPVKMILFSIPSSFAFCKTGPSSALSPAKSKCELGAVLSISAKISVKKPGF